MEITFEIDDRQAQWLADNLHEISPAQLAETLLSLHIANGCGAIPERFREVVGVDDYRDCAEAALLDHCDVTENVTRRRDRIAGAVKAAFEG